MRRLFVHGWATDPWVWAPAALELEGPKGPGPLNPALPSHTGGTLERWDTPDLSPAVRTIEKAVASAEGEKMVALGWSLGGMALLALPPEVLSRLAGLVLVGSTARFTSAEGYPHGQSPALVRRMIMDMKDDPESATSRFHGLNFTEAEADTDVARDFLDRYRYPGPVVCVEGAEGTPPGCYPAFDYVGITRALAALKDTDLRDRLGSIDLPVLVVHGTEDGVCPPGAGGYLAGKIPGAELRKIEGAGHASMLTRTGELAGLVKEFEERL